MSHNITQHPRAPSPPEPAGSLVLYRPAKVMTSAMGWPCKEPASKVIFGGFCPVDGVSATGYLLPQVGLETPVFSVSHEAECSEDAHSLQRKVRKAGSSAESLVKDQQLSRLIRWRGRVLLIGRKLSKKLAHFLRFISSSLVTSHDDGHISATLLHLEAGLTHVEL